MASGHDNSQNSESRGEQATKDKAAPWTTVQVQPPWGAPLPWAHFPRAAEGYNYPNSFDFPSTFRAQRSGARKER